MVTGNRLTGLSAKLQRKTPWELALEKMSPFKTGENQYNINAAFEAGLDRELLSQLFGEETILGLEKNDENLKLLEPFKTEEGLYDIGNASAAGIPLSTIKELFGEEGLEKLKQPDWGTIPELLPVEKLAGPQVKPQEIFQWSSPEVQAQFEQTVLPKLPQALKQAYTTMPDQEFKDLFVTWQEGERERLTGLLEKVMPSFFEHFSAEKKTGIGMQFMEKLQTDTNTQNLFIDAVLKQGHNPDTEQLLKELNPGITDRDIKVFFGEAVTPLDQLPLGSYKISQQALKEVVEWAQKDPEGLRLTFVTEGRNPDTETMLKSLYGEENITEDFLGRYFSDVESDRRKIVEDDWLRNPFVDRDAILGKYTKMYPPDIAEKLTNEEMAKYQLFSNEAIAEFWITPPTKEAISVWFKKWKGMDIGAQLNHYLVLRTGDDSAIDKSFLDKLSSTLTAGAGDFYSSLSGALKWMGISDKFTFEPFKYVLDLSKVAETAHVFAGKVPEGLGWQITRALPSSLSLIPLAIAGAFGGGELAAVLGAGRIIIWLASTLGSVAFSRPVESLLEVGSSYDELVKQYGEVEAQKKAGEIFKKNMALSGWDALQMAAALAPLPKGFNNIIKNTKLFQTVKVGGKIIIVGLTQGGEEVYQKVIQDNAAGKEIEWDDEMITVMTVGGIMGAILGMSGDVISTITENTRAKLSPEMQERLDNLIDQAKSQGLTDEIAQMQALEAISEERPENAEAVGTAINQTKQEAPAQKILSDEDLLEEQKNIREILSTEQSKGISALIEKTGWGAGQYPDVEIRVYRDLTGETPSPDMLTNDLKKVKSSDAIKVLAKQYGYSSANELRIAINNITNAKLKMEVLEIPVTEQGQPEAGLQPSMISEVSAKEVRPAGKGKVTQISMEDQIKLQKAREAAEPKAIEEPAVKVDEMQAELESLKEDLAQDPVAQKRIQIGVTKTGKPNLKTLDFFTSLKEGEFPEYLTVKQARAFKPHKSFAKYLQKGTKNYNKVPIDEVLDDIASEAGFESTEDFKEAINNLRNKKKRVKELETEIARAKEAQVSQAPEVSLAVSKVATTVKFEDIPITVLNATSLSKREVELTLELFKDAVASPELASQRAATLELRKRILARRASQTSARAEELIIEGKTPEQAIKLAEQEFMSGKLPTVNAEFMLEFSDEMRTVLFAKVYDYWTNVEPDWFELMSTAEALTNALRNGNIPNKTGVGTKAFPNGGSALLRLQRVFGGEPEVLKALNQGKPFEDIVEGIFHEIGRPPVPLDQKTVEYLRSLSDIPHGQESLFAERFKAPTVEDLRTAAEKLFAKRKLDLDRLLAEKKIDKSTYDLELALAQEKIKPYPPVTRYEPPVNDALKQPSMIPMKERLLIIRALQEVGATAIDIGNFLRANLASFDFSWWRQQAPLIMNHLGSFMNGNIESWKSIWSQKAAEASWERIIHDPLYHIYEQAGYDFLRPLHLPKGTAQWKGVEEYGYLGTERPIPKITAKIPWVNVSGRVFITGANEMNWRIFHRYYDAMIKVNEKIASGRIKLKSGEAFSIENNMKDFARMLGDFTGRAALGKAGAIAPAANALFFSMRLNLGRLLTPRHLVSSNHYVRAEAWKNLSTFVTTIGGVMLLGAAMGWWEVEKDPRSTDFMKLRIGDIRIDPWGGYQQFVVFFARVITKTGLVSSTGKEYPVDPLTAMTNFIRGKASPLAGVIADFLTGKNFLGDKVNIKNPAQWLDRVVPFALRDIWDAWSDKGLEGALLGLPAIFGANVQTYSGDWKDNALKLGLPKYDDNIPYSLRQPVYDTQDFWADTASQFSGVDPETLTEKKGFAPKIKAIAEAWQILDVLKDTPNVKLTSINADPEKGDTFVQFYAQWQERLKLGDDKDKLAAFDKRFPDAQLGNITQSQYVLLQQYHNLSAIEQKQFLKDHPELDINPRSEWLRTHPEENAQLAIWGQVNILTPEAYAEAKKLIKELDIPESALPERIFPPVAVAENYFKYLKKGENTGWNSWETQLIIARDDKLRDFLGRDPIETPPEALELKIKHRDLFTLRDSYSDKDSDAYIADDKEREEAIEKLKADNPLWVDDIRRVEAIENKGIQYQEAWVERGRIVDERTAGSSEAILWLVDHPDIHRWALEQKILEDDGSDWNIPVLRLNVQWREQDERYTAYGDVDSELYIDDDKARAEAREKYLTDNPEYRDARARRDVYAVKGTDAMAAIHVEYVKIVDEFSANSAEAKLFRIDHPDYDTWAQDKDTFGWSSLADENIQALRISAKWRQQDKEYDALPVEGDAREKYLAENEDYRKDRRRRDAFQMTGPVGETFPDTQVDNYVAYYELPEKGKRRDRFLMENPEFAKSMHKVAGMDLPTKVPSVQYDDIYDQYQEQFDRMEGLSDSKSEYYIEDPKARQRARDNMRFKNGKMTEFGTAEIRRKAYGQYIPDDYVERYVDYYKVLAEGIPENWPEDRNGDKLTWYEDDWYLIEHPAFYENIYLDLLELEKVDFTKVPSREIFQKYAVYVNKLEGKERQDYRFENPDLEKWLLLSGKVTTPITEQRRRANLTPAEKKREDIAELREIIKRD